MKFTYTCKKVSLNDSVKAVKVGGIEASAETVKDGSREKGRQAREVFQGGARGFCHLLCREEEPLCRRDHAPRRQRHAVPRGM